MSMKTARSPKLVATTLRLTEPTRHRLERLRFELRRPMQEIVEEAIRQYEHRRQARTADWLFEPRFMAAGLKKRHLKRADYYDA